VTFHLIESDVSSFFKKGFDGSLNHRSLFLVLESSKASFTGKAGLIRRLFFQHLYPKDHFEAGNE